MQVQTTSREFNRNPSGVKKQADDGPVIITERGKAAYVMLSYAEFSALKHGKASVLDSLAMPAAASVDFEPQRDASLSRTLDF